MLPQDPEMLRSVINTKLRDLYSCFDELIDDLGEDKEYIVGVLASAGYIYSREKNAFVSLGADK